MTAIIEGGLGTDLKGVFHASRDWRTALRALREGTNFERNSVVAFPQVCVFGYRIDFLVAVALPMYRRSTGARRWDAFFVECDGRAYHGLDPRHWDSAKIAADLSRERDVRRRTGLDMLRFTGPELSFRMDEVEEVLTAFVSGLLGIQEADLEAARRVADHARDMASHALTRHAYHHEKAVAAPFQKMRALLVALEEELLAVRSSVAYADEEEETADE